MRKFRFAFNILAIAVFSLAISSVAQAQATRTWVSGVGDDVNPCSRTAPCKTFAGAISKTATGGEIDVLDPGGFGGVTITKSLTIDGTTGAGFGSILAAGTTGVIINAGTGVVTLRNLSINGVGKSTSPGVTGVRVISAAKVYIENCTIFGFGTHGVDMNTASGIAQARLTIQDSTIEECSNSGVSVSSPTTNPVVNLEHVRIAGCGTGVNAGTNAVVAIHDSTLTINNNGIVTANGSLVNIETSSITLQVTNGIQVGAGSTARIGGNLIAQNPTGVANSGTTETTQDNRFLGNTNDVTGTALAPILKK